MISIVEYKSARTSFKIKLCGCASFNISQTRIRRSVYYRVNNRKDVGVNAVVLVMVHWSSISRHRASMKFPLRSSCRRVIRVYAFAWLFKLARI